MSAIIYLNHKRLADLIKTDREIDQLLKHHARYEWEYYWHTQDVFQQSSRYSRTVCNPWPFSNIMKEHKDWTIPEIWSDGMDFAQVTDKRANDLLQQADGRPWIISWSGGIDSTIIIVAVLKNIPPADRGDFIVCCNYFSIWENPVFFRDFIQPNFQTIDSTDRPDAAAYPGHLWVDGEAGDCLWGALLRYYCPDTDVSWKQNKTVLRDLFVYRGATVASADWMIELIGQQIVKSGLPIDTVDQFLWWHNFNNGWMTTLMRNTHYQNEINFKDLGNHILSWYDTSDYQKWSLRHNLVVPPDKIYKKAARQYIWEISKDIYHLHFKNKIISVGRKPDRDPKVIAVLDDGTYLLQNERQKLCELLPAHLQN